MRDLARSLPRQLQCNAKWDPVLVPCALASQPQSSRKVGSSVALLQDDIASSLKKCSYKKKAIC